MARRATSASRLQSDRAAPLLGEDSVAVLAELGYAAPDIDRLLEREVVKEPAQAVSR